MNYLPTVTFDDGLHNLLALVKDCVVPTWTWTEADTRFQFIDRLLTQCIGWPRDGFRMEDYQSGEYADYVLGKPGLFVLEAKKRDVYFELPPDTRGARIQSIVSLMMTSKALADAIRQVHTYAVDRGIEYAGVCNGHQLVVFVAITIGSAPLKGRAVVFRSLDEIATDFGTLWKILAPDGIGERRLHAMLTDFQGGLVPPKLSSRIPQFPKYKDKNDL